MAASYPSAIKTFTQLQDGVDTVLAAHPNERGDEITAIQAELGTSPKGSFADVKTRIASLSRLKFLATPVNKVAMSLATRTSANNVAFTDVDCTADVGSDAGNLSAVVLMVEHGGSSQVGESSIARFRLNGSSLDQSDMIKSQLDGATNSVADSGNRAEMLFVPVDSGDIFEYDINFVGGVGNHTFRINLVGYVVNGG
jgi:hypothetical protein